MRMVRSDSSHRGATSRTRRKVRREILEAADRPSVIVRLTPGVIAATFKSTGLNRFEPELMWKSLALKRVICRHHVELLPVLSYMRQRYRKQRQRSPVSKSSTDKHLFPGRQLFV